MLRKIHNPLQTSFTSTSLAGECKKAEKILDSFINSDIVILDKRIPRKVLENAKGLAIFSVFEVGMVRSLRFGSGLVVARLPNGTWSAPSAIATGKLSRGQFGMEHTDFVYVLNTDAAVEMFLQAKTFTLGQGGVSVVVGPFGRSAELAGDSYEADIFAYGKTRTVFGGSTLEGATMGERVDANRKMYQKTIAPKQLLRGEVELPPETYPLMKILHSTLLRPVSTRTRSASVDLPLTVARNVPQSFVAIELSSEPAKNLSQKTVLPVIEEKRFYRRHRQLPQIKIEITDCSATELPRSLTSYPEPMRSSLDQDPSSPPAQFPTVFKPGRRSWSGPSTGS